MRSIARAVAPAIAAATPPIVQNPLALALATASNFVPAIEKSVSNRNKLIRVNRRQLTAGLAADAATELVPEPPRRFAPAVG